MVSIQHFLLLSHRDVVTRMRHFKLTQLTYMPKGTCYENLYHLPWVLCDSRYSYEFVYLHAKHTLTVTLYRFPDIQLRRPSWSDYAVAFSPTIYQHSSAAIQKKKSMTCFALSRAFVQPLNWLVLPSKQETVHKAKNSILSYPHYDLENERAILSRDSVMEHCARNNVNAMRSSQSSLPIS